MESTSKEAQNLVAKKLRTGEIAVWDPQARAIILISTSGAQEAASARYIRGSTLKALEETLGDVVVLI